MAWAINKSLDLSAEFVRVQIPILLELVGELDPFLEEIISRPVDCQEKPKPRESILTRILNNPIVSRLLEFNPVVWILEATTEELDIKLPRTSFTFLSNAMEAMSGVLDDLGRLVLNIVERLATGVANPSTIRNILMECLRSSIWAIYDGFKKAAGAVFNSASELFTVFKDFLKEEWVIPGLTDLWEDLTGCPFSAINFITYVSAQVLEIFGSHKDLMGSLRQFRQVLEGCNVSQKFEEPHSNGLKRHQSLTNSRVLEEPPKKPKLQTNSVVTLRRPLGVNSTTPTFLASSIESRMVPNQNLRLLSDSNAAASNDASASASEDTNAKQDSKVTTEPGKETTPDSVLKASFTTRSA